MGHCDQNVIVGIESAQRIPAAPLAVIAHQDVLPLCCRNPTPPDGTKRYETDPDGPDNILEARRLKAKPAYLFGALVKDLALATRLARALWGDRIAEVTAVRLEYAPSPASAYLDDRTAFDALMEYVTEEGERGFVGIETKLSEPFSQRHCDGEAYRRWMTADSPWRPDAHERVDAIVHNQLWRDHLLAWAMIQRAGSPWSEGRLLVLHHPIDQHCARVVDGYRELLRDDETFESRTLDDVVRAWKAAAPEAGWIDSFAVRYTALEPSA